MRKTLLCSVASILLFAGCKKAGVQETEPVDEAVTIVSKRSCAANDVLEAQLAEDPAMRSRVQQIEAFTQKVIKNGFSGRLVNGTIEIPVVVHVVYNTASQNISDPQVQSQIDVLNEDFQNRNADRTKIPSGFSTVASSGVIVRFVLEQTIRKQTKTRSWGTDDAVKRTKRGGSDPVDPATKLNMWACNLGQGLLGYAQFPGGPLATDGVVILYSAFGSKAKASGVFTSTYDLGRTATHEVGHWMNLRHIWGDDGTSCSGSDLVADTPNQGGENYGCPKAGTSSCNNGPNGDMFMNYMDYTDDACMYMFTEKQKVRMLAVFSAGGPRAAIGL